MFNKRTMFLTILFVISMLITYSYILSESIQKEKLLILNSIVIIISVETIYKFILAKKDYHNINNKYLNTIDSLKNYEEMIDKYRILNHENKNQLLTIRGMILKGEKDTPKYIDTIIDTTIKDNEKLMFETNVIPSGGLRAIIYSKMLYMQDNNIKVKLEVERNIRKIDLSLDENFTLNICKVIGVFLDNSIEESIKNYKFIKIKLYLENNKLCILVSNKISKDFDLNKIDNTGFTTKDKGHGYGLSLVKNIIENDNRLINERYIDKNYFTQILKITI